MDIADREAMELLFAEHQFPRVIYLSAPTGARNSLKNPDTYIQSNVVGFMNILAGCRHNKVAHLVYACSSSVYGSPKFPSASTTIPIPGELICRDKEIERVDGAYVQPFMWVADDGTEFLYFLRPVGTTGHGADDFLKSHHGRHGD